MRNLFIAGIIAAALLGRVSFAEETSKTAKATKKATSEITKEADF